MSDLLATYEKARRKLQLASPAKMAFPGLQEEFDAAEKALLDRLALCEIPPAMPYIPLSTEEAQAAEKYARNAMLLVSRDGGNQGLITRIDWAPHMPVFAPAPGAPLTPDTADVLATWAESFAEDQVRLMDLAIGMAIMAMGEHTVTITTTEVSELIETFQIVRTTLPGNAGWTVKLLPRGDADQGNLDLEG